MRSRCSSWSDGTRVFGRRVRRGSVGIAVFGEPGTGKLRYYFDVSDTAAGEGARP